MGPVPAASGRRCLGAVPRLAAANPCDRPAVGQTEEGTLHEHQASNRELAIIDLLREFRLLEGASSSGAAGKIGGYEGGDRMLYMEGGDWDKSGCDALDEVLKQLRAERPVQWWHVTERYLRSEVRPRRVKTERTHSGNRRLPDPPHHAAYLSEGVRPKETWLAGEMIVIVETWSPQVRAEKVRRGVKFLAVNYPWRNRQHSHLTQAAAA